MSHLFKTFSHANIYAKFRPTAPQAFVEEVMKFVKVNISDFNLAVDVGCGPGISTTLLAPHFKEVHGYDVSEAQITEAKALNKFENVSFCVSPAEKIAEKHESVQLITVMQAVHWFDLDAFYKEVKRVLVPHGVLALGGYLIPKPVSKDQKRMDSIIQNEIYMGAIKKYWEPVRDIVDNMYRDIPPAFEDHVRLMEDAGKVGEDPAKTNLEVKTRFFTILARKPGP
ncbi:putative methyltransferase DDB_G0268948 isoform X2 [Dermacentor silvarum]|uniref:putative methyltransferase DDB_G0268948 isoform X2 n=1 Tax=Dermacentor silvarum TaxID=543639 RepID=UPI00189B8984|nr:putative methyltransferase DDB_G0268948 isoform X2 [Dermacentor silvarum]